MTCSECGRRARRLWGRASYKGKLVIKATEALCDECAKGRPFPTLAQLERERRLN